MVAPAVCLKDALAWYKFLTATRNPLRATLVISANSMFFTPSHSRRLKLAVWNLLAEISSPFQGLADITIIGVFTF